jgi:hypothetical protein
MEVWESWVGGGERVAVVVVGPYVPPSSESIALEKLVSLPHLT